jgi:hypothetical protein
MSDIRAMVSRHDDRGSRSGGGNAWHAVPHVSRAARSVAGGVAACWFEAIALNERGRTLAATSAPAQTNTSPLARHADVIEKS